MYEFHWLDLLYALTGIIVYIVLLGWVCAKVENWRWKRRLRREAPDEHTQGLEMDGRSEYAEMRKVLHYRGRNKAA